MKLQEPFRGCECVLVRKGDAERKSSPEGRVRYTGGIDCQREDLNICRRLLIRTIKGGGSYRWEIQSYCSDAYTYVNPQG